MVWNLEWKNAHLLVIEKNIFCGYGEVDQSAVLHLMQMQYCFAVVTVHLVLCLCCFSTSNSTTASVACPVQNFISCTYRYYPQ